MILGFAKDVRQAAQELGGRGRFFLEGGLREQLQSVPFLTSERALTLV